MIITMNRVLVLNQIIHKTRNILFTDGEMVFVLTTVTFSERRHGINFKESIRIVNLSPGRGKACVVFPKLVFVSITYAIDVLS